MELEINQWNGMKQIIYTHLIYYDLKCNQLKSEKEATHNGNYEK